MNRAERRRNGNKESPKTYVLTVDQINKIKSDAASRALELMLAIPVVVLHDKFGFGTDVRLPKFISYCQTWIRAVEQDPNTMKELIDLAEQEAGYHVEI